MAYFQQKILSAEAGGTAKTDTDSSSLIPIIGGGIPDSVINKAVTFDGVPSDLANPKVKLAASGEYVLGAIIGTSYGKLEIVVSGWDVKFINARPSILPIGVSIVGAEYGSEPNAVLGLVADHSVSSGDVGNAASIASAINSIQVHTGRVMHGGVANKAGEAIVRVAIHFGV